MKTIKGTQFLKFADDYTGIVEYSNGQKEWRLNGMLHREDGPAVVFYDDTKMWFLNGRRHRTDGPAVEWDGGTKEWWWNGLRHREDGPAVEHVNGAKQWFLYGYPLEKEQYKHLVNIIKLGYTKEVIVWLLKQRF